MKCIYLLITSLILSGCGTLVTRTAVKETEQRKQFQDQVSNLQKSSADINAKFNEIDSELRSLNGRADNIENKMQTEKNQESKMVSMIQYEELQKKVNLLEQELTLTKSKIEQLSQLKTEDKSQAKSVKKDVFEEADDFLAEKDFKRAILGYSKYRESFPKGRRFAEATYKIGVCFQELGQADEAKTFFDEVISKFPTSSEAKKAKVRLKSKR